MEKLKSLLLDIEPIKMEAFIRKNKLKQDIIDATSFLENSPSMSRRIWHIINMNLDPNVKCPVCNTEPGNFGTIEIRKNGKRIGSYRGYRPCSNMCTKTIISTGVGRTEDDRKKKFKDTCLKKYGVVHPMHVEDIKLKNAASVKQTYSEKYSEIQQKFKITNMSRYGVEFFQQADHARESARLMTMAKYVDRIATLRESKHEKWQEFIGDEYTIVKYVDNNNIIITHNTCGHKDTYRLGLVKRRMLNQSYVLCLKCSPLNYTISGLERQVADYCKKILNHDIEITNKTLIKPKQLDMVIHEHKIAIEFNGLYYHSDITKEQNYHQKKSLEVAKCGYHLLHIWEDDWVNKKQIVESIISGFLNSHTKVAARKCIIVEIDTKTSREFMDRCHIQGFASASIYYALKYDDNIVMIMSFTNRKDGKWELSRLCSELHTSVIGGASKLFTHFIRAMGPKHIFTYCDLSIFPGSIYLKLGFAQKHLTSPQYWYYNPHKGVKRWHRRNFQKKNLLKTNKDCSNLSENDIMILNGYYKIYGCGNFVYEWKNK